VATTVIVDRAGRISIPIEVRKKRDIRPGTRFLLADRTAGSIVLVRVDSEEFWQKLDQELKGVDIDAVTKRIRARINAQIRKKYPDVFG
jgi:AbrB family looped-hinge helix DNA binding protein